MRQRIIALVLAGGCIILAGVAFFMYTGQDRTAPEITIDKESITYTEGEDYDTLMRGVSASDDKDGDLTDQVFVDKIVPCGETEAVVYYGVMDSSKNVGTITRKVTYHPLDKKETKAEAEEGEPVENQGTETADAGLQEEVLQLDGDRPAIGLTAESMEIEAGTPFDALSVVSGVIDDVDAADDLSTRIQIEGTYNTEVPGTYALIYYVKDSNENLSDGKSFTLIGK